MSDLTGAAAQAIEQPHSDVINILLEQHRLIRELFKHVKRAEGRRKQQTFDELRILLAVHETAGEMVLRPVSCQDAGAAVADARNQEEKRGLQDAQRPGGGERVQRGVRPWRQHDRPLRLLPGGRGGAS